MTKTLRATDEEIRAARIEFYALQSAGLRPESLVRKLSQAPSMFTEQIEGRAPWVDPSGDVEFPKFHEDRAPAEALGDLSEFSGRYAAQEGTPRSQRRRRGPSPQGDVRKAARQSSRDSE